MTSPFPLDLKPEWRMPQELGMGPGLVPDAYALGDIWVQRHRQGPRIEYITVDEASAHVLVGDELLRDIQFGLHRHNSEGWLSLENLWDHAPAECPTCAWSKDHPAERPSHCFAGMLLRVDAQDRQLTYRIRGYRPQSRTWEAAWPD